MKASSAKKEYPFFDVYDKLIRDLKTGKKRLPDGTLYQKGSIETYEYVKKNLVAFCCKTDFELRLRPVKKLNKRELAAERNYWKKFYKKFTDYMHNTKNHNDNYVGLHMKTIRSFWNYANNDLALDIGNFHRELYVYKEDIPVIVLTSDRLRFLIHDKIFEESLPDRLKRAKDIFVFGSAVALRFSDLMVLKPANLLKADNSYYLSVRSKKTKTYTQVKLTDYAVEIIARYRKSGKMLLPTISNYNLNKYLKELAEKAGWTETIGKHREKRGRLKEIKNGTTPYRFCDLVTTHTMRRTAITTMLTLGAPEHIVRSFSGHTAASKEFFKYVAIAQTNKDQEIDKMQENLKKRA